MSLWSFLGKIGKGVVSALTGLGGVAGNVMNSKAQSDANKRQIESNERINQQNILSQQGINQANIDWAKEQYKLSKADSLERWRMENEYNSPAAQMERLKNAGLNPNLVYGSGATAMGGSIDSPQYNTPQLAAPTANFVDQGRTLNPVAGMVTGIGDALASTAMLSQIEKTKAETRRINVDQENQAFDLAVKKQLGINTLERNLAIKMQSENATNTKKIREFDVWMEAGFSNPDSDAEFSVDRLGTYAIKGTPILRSMQADFESNGLINAARKAGIDKTVQDLFLLKKRAVLYDDQHALNKVELELRNFTKKLTDYGISKDSAAALQVIVSILKTVFGR